MDIGLLETLDARSDASRTALDRLAEWFAAAGGFALIGVVVVEMVTIVGGLFGKPILGDTEIVEMLCGVAIACFLPYCQLRGTNVIVDFFTMRMPPRLRDGIDIVMHVVVAFVVVIVTWRLIDGAFTQYERGRVSMFLQLPQWWGYAGASLAALLWVAACCATVTRKLRTMALPVNG